MKFHVSAFWLYNLSKGSYASRTVVWHGSMWMWPVDTKFLMNVFQYKSFHSWIWPDHLLWPGSPPELRISLGAFLIRSTKMELKMFEDSKGTVSYWHMCNHSHLRMCTFLFLLPNTLLDLLDICTHLPILLSLSHVVVMECNEILRQCKGRGEQYTGDQN